MSPVSSFSIQIEDQKIEYPMYIYDTEEADMKLQVLL